MVIYGWLLVINLQILGVSYVQNPFDLWNVKCWDTLFFLSSWSTDHHWLPHAAALVPHPRAQDDESGRSSVPPSRSQWQPPFSQVLDAWVVAIACTPPCCRFCYVICSCQKKWHPIPYQGVVIFPIVSIVLGIIWTYFKSWPDNLISVSIWMCTYYI